MSEVVTWNFTCLDCDRNGVSRTIGANPPIRPCPDCKARGDQGRMVVYRCGTTHPLGKVAQANSAARREARELARLERESATIEADTTHKPNPEDH